MKSSLSLFLFFAGLQMANADMIFSGWLPFGNTSARVKFEIKDSPLDSTVEYSFDGETYKSDARFLFKLTPSKIALFFRMAAAVSGDYGANISIVHPLQLDNGTPLAFYEAYAKNSGHDISPPHNNGANGEYQVSSQQITCQ